MLKFGHVLANNSAYQHCPSLYQSLMHSFVGKKIKLIVRCLATYWDYCLTKMVQYFIHNCILLDPVDGFILCFFTLYTCINSVIYVIGNHAGNDMYQHGINDINVVSKVYVFQDLFDAKNIKMKKMPFSFFEVYQRLFQVQLT